MGRLSARRRYAFSLRADAFVSLVFMRVPRVRFREADELIACSLVGSEQFVELQMHGNAVLVGALLNEKLRQTGMNQ